jgi:hypothetical protein
MVDAYRYAADRGRVQFSDEFALSEDMIMCSPMISDGEELPYGKNLIALGVDLSDLATLDMAMYLKHMPDFRVTERLYFVADDRGFAHCVRFEGTTADGTVLTLHENDYFTTDEDGRICRWDVFLDWREWGAILGRLSGHTNRITWNEYMGSMLSFLPEAEKYVSSTTFANFERSGALKRISSGEFAI